MALNHVHLETIVHRESSDDSWSIVLTYGIDDESGEIVAETFETYRNHLRPEEGYRKSRGKFRVSGDKVPDVVAQEWRRLTGGKRERIGRKELGCVAV